MANRSCRRPPQRSQTTPPPLPPPEPLPILFDPPMRRWPHPIPSAILTPQPEPLLHYIRCALVYQNELLGEIKTLLEEITVSQSRE